MVAARDANLADRPGKRLRLHRISAADVPNADAAEEGASTQASDAYVRFTLMGSWGDEAPWVVTTYKLNEASPAFDGEEYDLPLPPDTGEGPVLQVEVIDKDFGDNEDDLIGEATLPLPDLEASASSP